MFSGLCPIKFNDADKFPSDASKQPSEQEDTSNKSFPTKPKFAPNGFLTNSSLLMSNKCSSSVGDLTNGTSPIDLKNGSYSGKYDSLSSQNVAVCVSLTSSPTGTTPPSQNLRRLPTVGGSYNDVSDIKNSNNTTCHSPSYRNVGGGAGSPRFSFQVCSVFDRQTTSDQECAFSLYICCLN